MRITIVNNIYWPQAIGGAELSVQLHAEELSRRGHKIQVICLGDEYAVDEHNGVKVVRIARQIPRLGKWTERIGSIRDISNKRMGERLLNEICLFDSDLLHTNNLSGFSWNIWETASKKGIPVLHTLRDFSLICRGAFFRNGRICQSRCGLCRIFTENRIRCSKFVNTVVGISGDCLERHMSSGVFTRTEYSTIIPNVGTGALLPDVGPRAIAQGPFRIGFIGRPAPEKGLELLCNAMSLECSPTKELHIAARLTETEKARLQLQCGDAIVKFHGFVPASEFMQEVDVIVVPSLWAEPLGRSAIESLCHGLPVVASCRGGLVDVVSDGVDGVLFNPDEGPMGLRAALNRVADPAEYHRMSIAALNGRNRFAASAILDAYELAYEETVRTIRKR